MEKIYKNRTHNLKIVRFVDGSSLILKKGQKESSKKEPKQVPDGVEVIEAKKPTKQKKNKVSEEKNIDKSTEELEGVE